MWQMLRKRIGARDGFTLIELVVVVAILGILAVIVTPKVMGAMDNAKTNSRNSSAKQIQVAMERYYAEQGAYPVPATVCDTDYVPGTGAGCTLTELKVPMKNYINLDSGTINEAITSYKVTAATTTVAASYELVVVFKDGSKSYTITADSYTAAP